ncbi:MAG: hypothetical protein KF791_08435 [Verrucomicrobiae bacterium]|nr:hypothetical protein [Verrucomicrobiae bacterium]
MDPILAINTATALINLAMKLRDEAQRKGEWTPAQEAAYRAKTKAAFETAAHWQPSGRTPSRARR